MASGCDIGVYYSPGNGGTISGATITGFTWYGVFNDGRKDVTVKDSTISDIGDSPAFDGAQHGVAIYFVNPNLNNIGLSSSGATGTIESNNISDYQKGGITVNGAGSSATVTGNTVTGLGPVHIIAQNGIQFGFGATPGTVSGNSVSGNIYTQNGSCAPSGVFSCVGVVSTGILYYDANVAATNSGRLQAGLATQNHVFGNQSNITIIQ